MKKLLLTKRILLISLSSACAVTIGAVFLTSYISWSNYYKEMIEKKEQFDKENEPEVTIMTGISVKVKDGVGFFKNGRADASKSNFIVEGNYTIGNTVNQREYTEELTGNEYNLTVPSDFTENGGDLVFNYTKTEVKKDENGEVIKDEEGKDVYETIYDFTETLSIDLLDVKLDHLQITQNPYIVCYTEGDKFNIEGLKVDAIYNDGTKIDDLNNSLLSYSKEKLSLDTSSFKVDYKYGENEDEIISCYVPIKVMSKGEFSNGQLENLVVFSDTSIEEGKDINSFKPTVYGNYSSGNYLLLDESKYTLSGLKGVAEFGKKYNVTITSKENNNVSTRIKLTTTKNIFANDASIKGATKYDNYVKDFDSGDYIEFKYNSKEATNANLSLKMSNGYLNYENGKFYANNIDFNDFAYLSINGKIRDTNYTFTNVGPFDYMSEAYNNYQNINLGMYQLNEGDNLIRISFKDSNLDLKSAFDNYVAGAIEKLEISASNNEQYSSLGEYVNAGNNDYIVTKEKEWANDINGKSISWIYASCTDDEYIYYYVFFEAGTAANIGKEAASIVKYNPYSHTVEGYSAPMIFSGETITPMFVKDNFVYVMSNEGVFMRLPTSFTGNGTAKVEFIPNMIFKGIDNKNIKSMYFNHKTRKYVVAFDNSIGIFNASFEQENLFGKFRNSYAAKNNKGNNSTVVFSKLTGDDNYIYALYKANGVISPAISIYDYEGNLIKDIQPTNTQEIMGFDSLDNCNVQSIVSLDDNIYFTVLRWSKGNNSSIYKVAPIGKGNQTTQVNYDLYEYISSCENKGKTPIYNKTMVSGSQINDTYQYAHGICSDNEYIYLSSNNPQGETFITKIDANTGKFIGKTNTFVRTSTWSNGDYLMYKDGYIYLFTFNNIVKRVKANTITDSNTPNLEDYEMNIEGINGNKTAGTYNATVNKMAINAGGKLYIVGGKSLKVENSVSCSGKLGIASDANYIYAFKEKSNAYGTAKFTVYDWSGNLIKDDVLVENLITEQNNNNVQGMTIVNGVCTFLVCRWNSRPQLIKTTFDTTILK